MIDLTAITNVVVQGITGTHGQFHTAAMREFGTNIIAGTSPNKAGQTIHDVPVYSSLQDIQATGKTIDASVVFVPARFAKAAIMEAITANVPLIVCITEGIPVHDMLTIRQALATSDSIMLGPNCPGLIAPAAQLKLGIIPAAISTPGTVAVVSRSGTLTYEVTARLTQAGLGQKYVIGIGGDPIKGSDFTDWLAVFEADSEVDTIIMIGEIGGDSERTAADYIRQAVTKPVYSYVAGWHAPVGVQLGHAGAILRSSKETAAHKSDYIAKAGVHVYTSLHNLVTGVLEDTV